MISISHILRYQKSLFAKELAFFSAWLIVSKTLQPIRNLFIRRIEVLFDKAYIIALGAHEVSKSYTQIEAYEHLSVVKSTIVQFNRFRSRLEEVEFVGSKELKSKSNLVLDALYDLDLQIRMKSFSGLPRNGTDPKIIDCLVLMSKEAMQSVLPFN
jgi:hypothetical protein